MIFKQTFKPINYLIVIMVFHLIEVRPVSLTLPNTVIMYTEPNSNGLNVTVSVTKCISPIHKVLGGRIAALNVRGNCVNVYRGENCTDEFITIKPGTPAHENLQRWDHLNWKSELAQSIGPCDAPCSSRNIHKPQKVLIVTLYDYIYFDGSKTTLTVNGCTIIPKKMRRKATSVKVHGQGCIELHKVWNCSGQSIQIPSNTPPVLAADLASWDFDDRPVAASPCGYNCYRTQLRRSDEKVEFQIPMWKNALTFFTEPGFQGESKNLSLDDLDCFTVTDKWGWGEAVQSILTYGICIEIFETDLNCNRSNGKTLRLNDSESDVLTYGWNNGMKSIGFCPNETTMPSSNTLESKLQWSHPITYVLLSLFGVVMVVTILTSIYIVKLRKNNKRLATVISHKEIDEFRNGTGTAVTESLVMTNENMYQVLSNRPYDKSFEIAMEYIQFDKNSILGEGEFGIVYRGRTHPPTFSEEVAVAVKSVKPFCDVQYIRAMLKEIKTMIYVGKHSNIILLIGCNTNNLHQAELFIMTQLCGNGSLLKFLQNYQHSFDDLLNKDYLPSKLKSNDTRASANSDRKGSEVLRKTINGSNFSSVHLIQWSLHIAQGMEHLSNKRVIHGDLAARNVLLDDCFTAKISDFGLSTQLYSDVNYMKKSKVPLPWRCMAIESLRSLQFSIESDIWAFGMTLWEIFTLGGLPYPGKVWGESFLDELANGLRPSKPKYATDELYDIMTKCWNENPTLRVPFSVLRQTFGESFALHLKNNLDPNFENEYTIVDPIA